MHSILHDLQYAARGLRKSPAFTLTAVLCLGLAIGANTALFAIFHTMLWKPLPVARPQSLVRIFATNPLDPGDYRSFSYPEYLDYREQADVLEDLAATREVAVALRTEGTEAARVFAEAVTDNYFEMLGLRPQLGRLLAPRADGRVSTAPEVVLSHRLWERRFQSAPDVVGTTVLLTGVAYTIVGVTPQAFRGTYPVTIFGPELWLPLGTLPQIDRGSAKMFEDRNRRPNHLLGRLKPGVSLARAQASAATVAARLARSYPESNEDVKALVFREIDTRPQVNSSKELNLVAVLFLGLAALVLVVACANLANLLLVRGVARRKEIAMRLALGARRGHLVRQLLAEAILLSALAGGVGVLAAAAVARGISSVSLPTDIPTMFEASIDLRVLLFTGALSGVAAVAFGLVPALGASRPHLMAILKGADVSGAGKPRRLTLTASLVVAQVACSLVLLVAAGLFYRSIGGADTFDPGFATSGRTVVSFDPSLLRYDGRRTEVFYRNLLARVGQSPAIGSAGLAAWLPLGFFGNQGDFVIQGRETGTGDNEIDAFLNSVSPTFLETMGVSIRVGRGFTEQDKAETLPVVIVNETLARTAWPGLDPIGRQLRRDREGAPWLTVVGVVADHKYRGLKEPRRPYVLRPLSQAPTDGLTLLVVDRGDHASSLAAIRRDVQALDPDMPLMDAKTMEQQIALVRFQPQAMAAMAGPAAGLALLIAAIGLYGVIACSVARRTREFGIRLAIGARPGQVVSQVMSRGLVMVGIGLALGIPAALGLAAMMESVLVGVSPADPVVFATSIFGLIVLALIATYLPARHASRVDPLVALRHD